MLYMWNNEVELEINKINFFTATIDSQLQELNNRFSEHAVKSLPEEAQDDLGP